MLALLLQIAGLAGLPVGGALLAGPGGGVLGASAAALLVGVALERAEGEG